MVLVEDFAEKINFLVKNLLPYPFNVRELAAIGETILTTVGNNAIGTGEH